MNPAPNLQSVPRPRARVDWQRSIESWIAALVPVAMLAAGAEQIWGRVGLGVVLLAGGAWLFAGNLLRNQK